MMKFSSAINVALELSEHLAYWLQDNMLKCLASFHFLWNYKNSPICPTSWMWWSECTRQRVWRSCVGPEGERTGLLTLHPTVYRHTRAFRPSCRLLLCLLSCSPKRHRRVMAAVSIWTRPASQAVRTSASCSPTKALQRHRTCCCFCTVVATLTSPSLDWASTWHCLKQVRVDKGFQAQRHIERELIEGRVL